MEYDYVRIGSAERPMLPVAVRKIGPGGNEIHLEALVDSGADDNVFDAQYADLLGIRDLEEGIAIKLAGITGIEKTGYSHEVILKFDSYSFYTSVIFLPDMEEDMKAILGQTGFFDFVQVTFRRSKGIFDVKPERR